jgi:L-amino acid N-acyltransferase YncA
MEKLIRKATENDLNAINDIYNYYVLNSTCTFQTEIETIQDRMNWFQSHGGEYPIIVCEINKEIIGWASLSPFHKRQAYKPTVENSVYISNDNLRKGLGASLLKEIIKLAKNIGYHSIIAKISEDQNASVVLHEKFSFQKVAHLKEVGFKFNKRIDVVFYQLII